MAGYTPLDRNNEFTTMAYLWGIRTMIELSTLPATVQALLFVGVILFEAVFLYVGYGAIEKVAGPRIKRAITRGE